MRPILLALCLVGCANPVPSAVPTADLDLPGASTPPATPATSPCSTVMNLELVPLDIWGRDLGDVSVHTDRLPEGILDPDLGPGVLTARLGDEPVVLEVVLDAPDHASAALSLRWDGSDLRVDASEGSHRVVTGGGLRPLSGTDCPMTTVYVGLDHTWFAATGAAPSMNRAELLMDGEEYWGRVYEDLVGAERRVTLSTWWWDSDFQFVREDRWTPQSQRWAYTALGAIEGLQGVTTRILVTHFGAGDVPYGELINTDEPLRDAAVQPGDDIEVILQSNDVYIPLFGQVELPTPGFQFRPRIRSNPRYSQRHLDGGQLPPPFDIEAPAGSWHQKAVVIDGEVAFVSGLNIKPGDWDSSDHEIYDPRRLPHAASSSDWSAVEDRENRPSVSPPIPDTGMRKDYGVRIVGPAVRVVEEHLADRWALARADGDLYSEGTTTPLLDPAPAPVSTSDGGVPLQVVMTAPPPLQEQSILETHLKAVRAAEAYIFIEDQFFRAPELQSAILHQMATHPDLVLVLLTRPALSFEPGAQHTWLAHGLLEELYGDRYMAFDLFSAELVVDEGWLWDDVLADFANIYIHSKLRIVDDRYLSVGSANVNHRSYLYDGEMDVTVLDEAWVTAARRRILANVVGPQRAGELTDDMGHNLALMREIATRNAAVRTWWDTHGDDLDATEARAAWSTHRPVGMLYPADIPSDYLLDHGPDAF